MPSMHQQLKITISVLDFLDSALLWTILFLVSIWDNMAIEWSYFFFSSSCLYKLQVLLTKWCWSNFFNFWNQGWWPNMFKQILMWELLLAIRILNERQAFLTYQVKWLTCPVLNEAPRLVIFPTVDPLQNLCQLFLKPACIQQTGNTCPPGRLFPK